jgi:hypothetical protein
VDAKKDEPSAEVPAPKTPEKPVEKASEPKKAAPAKKEKKEGSADEPDDGL